MNSKIYSHSLKYSILCAPLLVLANSSHIIRYTPFRFYLVYFVSFQVLMSLIGQTTGKSNKSSYRDFLSNSRFFYILLAVCVLGIMYGLNSIKLDPSATKWSFYIVLFTSTFLALATRTYLKIAFPLSIGLKLLADSLLVYTGFEVLNFHARILAGFFSLSIGLVTTALFLVEKIDKIQKSAKLDSQPERTRTQRRKKNQIIEEIQGQVIYFKVASVLFTLGPLVFVGMSIFGYLPGKFSGVVIILLLFQKQLIFAQSGLKLTDLPTNFLLQCTSFCYLFFAMILLIRIWPL